MVFLFGNCTNQNILMAKNDTVNMNPNDGSGVGALITGLCSSIIKKISKRGHSHYRPSKNLKWPHETAGLSEKSCL